MQILLRSCIDVHFAVVISTPLNLFFLLWNWTVTITRPDVKTEMVFQCFKVTLMVFVGGDSDH